MYDLIALMGNTEYGKSDYPQRLRVRARIGFTLPPRAADHTARTRSSAGMPLVRATRRRSRWIW